MRSGVGEMWQPRMVLPKEITGNIFPWASLCVDDPEGNYQEVNSERKEFSQP